VVGKPEGGCARQENQVVEAAPKAEKLTPKMKKKSIEAAKYHRIRTGKIRDIKMRSSRIQEERDQLISGGNVYQKYRGNNVKKACDENKAIRVPQRP
jgi:hypothetical protein